MARREESEQHLTPEQAAAVVAFFDQATEAVLGTGQHEGHDLEKHGRCVYCSCGFRVGQADYKSLLRMRREQRS